MSFPYMLWFGVSRSFFTLGRATDIAAAIRSPFPGGSRHPCAMNGPDEKVQLAHVVERLEERFPSLSTQEIEVIVAEQVALLDGNPIRDYVPRLVEHAARSRLRELAGLDRPPAPPTEPREALTPAH